MKIIQSGAFRRKVKRFNTRQKLQLDEAIRNIIKNPSLGTRKKGDLGSVYIHKFYIDKTLYLLAYSFSADQLELIMLGPHENYYSFLKTYLK